MAAVGSIQRVRPLEQPLCCYLEAKPGRATPQPDRLTSTALAERPQECDILGAAGPVLPAKCHPHPNRCAASMFSGSWAQG